MIYGILAGLFFPAIYLVVAAIGIWFSMGQREKFPHASKSALVGFVCFFVVATIWSALLLAGAWYMQANENSPPRLETLSIVWESSRNLLTVFALIMIGRAVFLDRESSAATQDTLA